MELTEEQKAENLRRYQENKRKREAWEKSPKGRASDLISRLESACMDCGCGELALEEGLQEPYSLDNLERATMRAENLYEDKDTIKQFLGDWIYEYPEADRMEVLEAVFEAGHLPVQAAVLELIDRHN